MRGSPGGPRTLGLPGRLTALAVPVLGLPLHWPGAAGRAGTGRGAADPLGELTVLLVLERSEETQSRVAVGVGMGPTSHTSAIKGLGSMALRERDDTRNKDTDVPCALPAKAVLHKREPARPHAISSSPTSRFHAARPGPGS